MASPCACLSGYAVLFIISKCCMIKKHLQQAEIAVHFFPNSTQTHVVTYTNSVVCPDQRPDPIRADRPVFLY